MNADRVRRTLGMLPSLFYAAQSMVLGKPAATVTRWDVEAMDALIETEEATFAEVKAVIEWLWFDQRPTAAHWRRQVSDVVGFCNAYRTLCDRMDETFTRAGKAAPDHHLVARNAAAGALNLTVSDIDRIHAAALDVAAAMDGPMVVGTRSVEPGDFGAMREALPPRKDLDS